MAVMITTILLGCLILLVCLTLIYLNRLIRLKNQDIEMKAAAAKNNESPTAPGTPFVASGPMPEVKTHNNEPSAELQIPDFHQTPFDPNDPKWQAAAQNEENLYELKIQSVIEVSDGSTRSVDPNRFEVFHPDRNQTLDIIVSKQIVQKSLKREDG